MLSMELWYLNFNKKVLIFVEGFNSLIHLGRPYECYKYTTNMIYTLGEFTEKYHTLKIPICNVCIQSTALLMLHLSCQNNKTHYPLNWPSHAHSYNQATYTHNSIQKSFMQLFCVLTIWAGSNFNNKAHMDDQ